MVALTNGNKEFNFKKGAFRGHNAPVKKINCPFL